MTRIATAPPEPDRPGLGALPAVMLPDGRA